MAKLLSVEDLEPGKTAARFDGRDHGATVSFFINYHPPGAGPGLHYHPYEETFIVQEGTGTFTVDGEEIVARAGQIVIVPAGAVHGFKNTGEGMLRQVSIHPHDHVVQTFLDE
jgi:quercetin dioxygenase-like cupin family protein